MALEKTPSFTDQVKSFQSFATTDGEISDGGATPREAEVLAAREQSGIAGKPANEALVPIKDAAKEPATETNEEPTETAEAAENEAETASETTDEPAKEPAASDATKKPNKTPAAERIGQAVKKQRAAERDADAERTARIELQKRLDAIEARLTPAKDNATTQTDNPPDPTKFEFGQLDEKYISALAEHKAEQKFKQLQAQQEKSRQADAAAAQQREIQQRAATVIEAGRGKYDDFDETVLQSPVINKELTQVVHDLVLDSDVGSDIAYHLATHPKEAREIFSKSPARQAAMIGQLEAKFSAASAAGSDKPIKVTKAPPPVKPARGAGSKVQVPPDTSDFAAFEAMAMGRQRRE